MADLFEYLKWRSDVPFSVAPLNDVDNLVLAELAYSDFSGVVPSDGRSLPVAEVCERFFRIHDREEIRKSTSFTGKAPLLMEHMVKGGRFGTMQLCRYVDNLDEEKTAQMSAVTYLLDDGTIYVAFRGTDSTLVGWKEDFDIGCLTETRGQLLAVSYLERVAEAFDAPIRVGGHSKGGNFAVYAASFCSAEIQDRILGVYSNDGPGFRKEVTEMPGYLRILPKLCKIVPDTSMIGMLLTDKAAQRVVKSSASGILQHDAFSWLTERDGFEPAEPSDLGKLLNNVLASWIDGMDDHLRSSVVDTIFDAFEATGADTFHEIAQQKWKSAEAMLGYLFKIPREKQEELFQLAGSLLKNSGQAALTQLQELLNGKEESNSSGYEQPSFLGNVGALNLSGKAAPASMAGTPYRVICVDEDGNPVQGATIQFCSDIQCMMGKTDADGVAEFDEAPGSYIVHLLKVPEGYAKDTTEYEAPAVPGDLTIVVKAA